MPSVCDEQTCEHASAVEPAPAGALVCSDGFCAAAETHASGGEPGRRWRGASRLRALGLVSLCSFVGLGMARSDPPPLPPVEVIAQGAHPASVDSVQRLLREMHVAPHLRERLRAARLSVVIVPRRVPLTEVPQFASLRGKKTFDGRRWDHVRGSGGMRLQNGRVAVAIPEENLFGWGDDPYPALAIAVHEIAHAIHDRVLTPEDRARVAVAYRSRLERGGPFTDGYARSNVSEYFAQGANAFFGRYPSRLGRDASWLYAHDRELYAALVRVFGPPRARPVCGMI